jgi:hypothetical protein
MNAVEIESAVSELAAGAFDPGEFPYAFLQAFGNKDTTLRRLRSGESNKSDLGGVLQARNIHILAAQPGRVGEALAALKSSPATRRWKADVILATDGQELEAEDLQSGETVACAYQDLPNHFGFFLPLAGITTVKQIRENSFDIRATGRLNKLYLELQKDNPDWASAGRSGEMNHFMARLIFCFFAEDTGIFPSESLFSKTIELMSERDGSNTHQVIGEVFRAMDTRPGDRGAAGIPRWADAFPYVNGGLFAGSREAPRFSRIARSFLAHIGQLDWTRINPDIFGSMIQAVADDEERGALGMHYTSVPNILNVLNPLFLDELRARLAEAGDNPRALLNLRRRLARIRVFDPACGSGNFLVIAYKEMRAIEAEINQRRNEPLQNRLSSIPLTNFRGIELRSFPAEIARLALVIAEYQCNVLHLGRQQALDVFLPLSSDNWITCGNALRLDWLEVCPPSSTAAAAGPDLGFENEGGEIYICGNPPYLGSQDQSAVQKEDLRLAFDGAIPSTNSADYVSGWFIKASRYVAQQGGAFAFVTTNSICQGRQVPLCWPAFLGAGLEIIFAFPSIVWGNLASRKAAVIVSIVGVAPRSRRPKFIFDKGLVKACGLIGPYLVPEHDTIVAASRKPLSRLTPMTNGSMPNDGGGLLLTADERRELLARHPEASRFCRKFFGSHDSIQGDMRYCLWIEDAGRDEAATIPDIQERIERVRAHRAESGRDGTRALAAIPHAFGERRHQDGDALLIPRHSSASRPCLPSILVSDDTIIGDAAIAMYGFTLVDVAIYSSRMHLVWVATVCGKIKEDYRYSNTLGWNTFPLPPLTAKMRDDLGRCAEEILLARERQFPAGIAELYGDPETMPEELRQAHEHNDEVLERIYVGRRFRNDTERLEKLFERYERMTAVPPAWNARTKPRA